MKLNTFPLNQNSNLLSSLLSTGRPIENLILSTPRGHASSLAFGPDPKSKTNKNLVMVVENDIPTDSAVFDATVLKTKYKNVNSYFEPNVIADTGKTRLAFEEVEEHREKNGARWNEASGIFEIRPSFVGNLCISYLINNRADIKVTQKILEDRHFYPKDYYVIEIFHLGELPGIEKYAVLKEKLVKYAGN